MFFRKILSRIALFIIKLNLFTSRIKFFDKEVLDDYVKNKKQTLIGFWHNRQFMLFDAHKNKNIACLVSSHKDGDYPSNILNFLGYKVVRGSSTHDGLKALVQISKEIKNKKNIGIAVDGPRGPLYESKEGIIFLAQKFELPIVATVASSKSYWQFKSWDKFIVPKFFTTIYIKYKGPFFVSKNDNIKEKTKEFTKYLYNLQKDLDNLISHDRS